MREALPGDFNRRIGEVHAVAISACSRPLEVVCSGTHSYFQNLFAVVAGELRNGVNERLDGIAVLFNTFEPLAAVLRPVADHYSTGSAGELLPVSANLIVQ